MATRGKQLIVDFLALKQSADRTGDEIWRKLSLPSSIASVSDKEDILVNALETAQPIQVGENAESPIAMVTAMLEDDDVTKPAIFAELMVLSKEESDSSPVIGTESSLVWREHARWLKYEETVEEEGTRFSKPHITLLTIQALLQLKNCLRHASPGLLDVSFDNYEQLVTLIMQNWESRHLFCRKEADFLRRVLLANKRHVISEKVWKQKLLNVGAIRRTKTCSLVYDDHPHPSDSHMFKGLTMDSTISQEDHPYQVSAAPIQQQGLARKMPAGSEAAVILIGTVPLLHSPIAEFIRFGTAHMLHPNMPEIELPTRFLFILLVPNDHQCKTAALDIGRAFGTMITDEVFSRVAFKAHDNNILSNGVEEFLSQMLLVPPGKWNPQQRWEPNFDIMPTKRPLPVMMVNQQQMELKDEEVPETGLQFTGRPFGGLVEDVKRKSKFYISDFTDALTGRPTQILAASLLLFIANVTKIITFGGVMGLILDGHMGAVENLLSGGICGVIYGLFAGQPLAALSATGPTLVFEFIMYDLCKRLGWDFLSMRFWVGCWTALFLMVIVGTDASVIVATITRFTEEAFATLISIIFIVQAFQELGNIGHDAPVISHPETFLYNASCLCNVTIPDTSFEMYSNFTPKECTAVGGALVGELCQYQPDVFLFSILLFLGTFVIAIGLKWFRHSGYLPSKLREGIADLNVTIAVVAMTGVSVLVSLDVPKLQVPHEFKPTMDRPWLVNPMNIAHWWVILACVFPGIFFTILVFMDQQITAVIVNRRDNRLRKGFGYHLDLFVISILIMISAAIGIPYYVAATIISIIHLESLRVRSEAAAPGEKTKFLGVNEQRVTAVVAHILVGLTIILTPVMKLIPFAILLGIFLYMGVVALSGQQFVQRVLIFFMPTKYQPDYTWLRVVHLKRVHLFTVIQILSLVILFAVKYTKTIAMAFPFMLIVMVIIRNVLITRIFTRKELSALDDLVPPVKQLFKKRPTLVAANKQTDVIASAGKPITEYGLGSEAVVVDNTATDGSKKTENDPMAN